MPTSNGNSKKGVPLLNVSFVNLNTGQPGPSATSSASQSSPAETHPPSSPSSPADNGSSSSDGASAPRLPHQQSSHAPRDASSSCAHAPQLQQPTPQLWNRVLQLWPWYQHSPPQPLSPHTAQSTAGKSPRFGPDPSTKFTEAGKEAVSIITGQPVEVVPDFSIDPCSMEEEEVDALRNALEQNLPLTAPAPFVLDLQYKVSPQYKN